MIFKGCLSAIKKLPDYSSEDFERIFGLTRAEFESVETNFPNWDLHDEGTGGCDDSWLAINNTFAYFLNGSEDQKRILYDSVSFSKDEVQDLRMRFDQI